ncbi:MAG: VTT domain-containing protein [Myxococcota bacterium]|jgi:uncharacterized membrane protein YdjX (TVP38/TMEM64 family)|nr:VTT domain-containing protein [Myxococcota bacterium]
MSRSRWIVLVVCVVFSLGAAALLAWQFEAIHFWMASLAEEPEVVSLLALFLLALGLEMLWIPRMWVGAALGAVLGPVLGAFLAFGVDLCSAFVCAEIGRSAWSEALRARLERHRAWTVAERLVSWRWGAGVAMLRLLPVAHYTFVSYASGVLNVSRRKYLLGNVLGLLPGALLYPVAGDAAASSRLDLLGWIVLAVVLLGVCARLSSRRFRRRSDALEAPKP